MYSVSISTNNKLISNNAFRQNAEQSLQKFQKVADFNKITERNPDKIIQLMKWLKNENGLNGVGYRVASTICHFMWPNIVPIVDRMVFRAIGNSDEDSDIYAEDMDCVKRYIEHNWALSDRYSPVFPSHLHETPVRLIDMSLWVIR